MWLLRAFKSEIVEEVTVAKVVVRKYQCIRVNNPQAIGKKIENRLLKKEEGTEKFSGWRKREK